MRWPTSIPGLMRAVTKLRPTLSTPSAMRVTTVMAVERRRAPGHRHVPPRAVIRTADSAIGTTRLVLRAARRGHGTARRPGPDGLSVLLVGQIAAHRTDRLSQRQYHHPRGGHGRPRYCDDLGCRHPDLGRQPDRAGQGCGHPAIAQDAGHALRDPALYWARQILARLSTSQGRAGPSAIDHGGHVHPRNHGAAL